MILFFYIFFYLESHVEKYRHCHFTTLYLLVSNGADKNSLKIQKAYERTTEKKNNHRNIGLFLPSIFDRIISPFDTILYKFIYYEKKYISHIIYLFFPSMNLFVFISILILF